MMAKITYKVASIPHPWKSEMKQGCVNCWCLIKVTTPQHGSVTEEPVAIFNLDSEALTFQGHVMTQRGSPHPIIDIDPDVEHTYTLDARRKKGEL